MEEKEVKWYKYGYFWRRGDNDGNETPQDWDDGTGDLIWNTLTKIRKDGDTSEWAVVSFFECWQLLMDRKRFPDEFVYDDRSKKEQKRMSRDPFIALGSVYAFFMRNLTKDLWKAVIQADFELLTIPLHLQYSIFTMLWWRRLKYDNRKHYVKRLDYFKALATEDTFLRKYEDNFYEDTV